MRATRFITVTALFTALLICVQFALSGIAGVELVTVFLLAFCFSVGAKAGVTVAVCFSVLRCFVFGFYPSVIILYLAYYSWFSLFFGFFVCFASDVIVVKTTKILTLIVLSYIINLQNRRRAEGPKELYGTTPMGIDGNADAFRVCKVVLR